MKEKATIELTEKQIHYIRDCMTTREYEGGGFDGGLDWELLQLLEELHREK